MSDIALPSFGTFVDSNTVYLNTSDVHLVRRQFLVAGTLIAGIVGGLNIARALTIIAIVSSLDHTYVDLSTCYRS